MKVRIRETGAIEELVIIDRESGFDWSRDLIGHAGALADGQFVHDQDVDVYDASQAAYDWWAIQIGRLERIGDLLQQLDMAGVTGDELDSAMADTSDRGSAEQAEALLVTLQFFLIRLREEDGGHEC